MPVLRACLVLCLAVFMAPVRAGAPDAVFIGIQFTDVNGVSFHSAVNELAFDGAPIELGSPPVEHWLHQWTFSFDAAGVHATLVEDFFESSYYNRINIVTYRDPVLRYVDGRAFVDCPAGVARCPGLVALNPWTVLPLGYAGTDKVFVPITQVPEPGSLALMLAGLGVVAAAARRGRRPACSQ